MIKQNLLGFFTLLLAVIALGLAVLPGIAFDRPAQGLFQPKPAEEPPLPTETKGGMTFRYKGYSLNVGGQTKPVEAAAEARAAEKVAQENVSDWLRNFTLAAVGCALLAAVLGPVAWIKEKQPAIAAPALVIATLALTWQFIAVGIAVGVALAVFVIVLGSIG